MKILFDARPIISAPFGGVGRVTFQIAKALAQHPEVELTLFTTGASRPSLPEELIQPNRVRHLHFKVPNKLWSLACILGFRPIGWFLQEKPDAVFLPNLGFAGIPRDWPSFLLLHDLSFFIEPRWFGWWQGLVWHRAVRPRRLAHEAQHVFCVSKCTMRDAERLLQLVRDKMSVIPMGGTMDSAIHSRQSSKDFSAPPTPFVLAFGEHDARKNFQTAKFAVEELKREPQFKDLALLAIGSDIRPTDAELGILYSQASALLYPSWYEGYGLPLHEAARFGCPRIASTAGALPETAPNGTLFAHPAKPQQWMTLLRSVLQQRKRETSKFFPDWTPCTQHLLSRMKEATNTKNP